ncbi:MAG: RsiV family protein [Syntrophomonas sp.]
MAENQSYYIQNGVLVVYFSQYEIAPYAAGIPEFKIPLSNFQDGIRADLLQ